MRFEGGNLIVKSATLDIEQVTGDGGFTTVTSLELPVEVVTGQTLSIGQGSLTVSVEFIALTKFDSLVKTRFEEVPAI